MMEDRRLRIEDGGQRKEERGTNSKVSRLLSVVCHLFLVFLLIFLAGCGRKSDPFLSVQKNVTIGVDQLRGAWMEQSLVLKGLVRGDKTSRSLITGCRVYYVWYSLDQPPCEGCPIDMASFRDITDQIIKNDQLECRLPAFKQKGICFVMVRIMEKGGLLGPESNRIKLISDR
jgi:hypothetical protein